MNLNPQQFPRKHVVLTSEGEHEIPSTMQNTILPIEEVRKGDFFREGRHAGEVPGRPFYVAHGDAVHDPSHPSDTSNDPEADPVKMYVIPTERGFTPHRSDGSGYEVYR